ncbi:MAG: DUF2796 domain-containing protein [Porticoccaceae bacterium]
MKKPFVNIVSLVVVLMGVAPSIYAEKNETNLDAHVHGLSELTIASEGEDLKIQLTSPAMNIVGFEYKAVSKKDIEAIKNAESILNQPEVLFLFSDNGCKPINIDLDISGLVEEDDHGQHDNKQNHHKDHDDHEDHDDHKEHDDHKDHENDKHEDHHKHDKHEDHSEIVANYSYRCMDIAKLSSIQVSLFEAFSGIHKIHTMWLTPSKQGSVTLTAKNQMVEFR